MTQRLRAATPLLVAVCTLIVGPTAMTSAAHADNDVNTFVPNNKRLNNSVVANVYTIQHQAGCTNDVRINPQLQLAAQWHTDDVLNNRDLEADIGSDGSTAQDRANAAGFHGPVTETVAINPALAINGIDILNQWYHNPTDLAIMQDCSHTLMGVWSENSLDRSVVVAVYGKPDDPDAIGLSADDPNPDYDGSSELEYGLDWLPWILRGAYPPPAYPPQ
jgi:uncharacterized protein YkwD